MKNYSGILILMMAVALPWQMPGDVDPFYIKIFQEAKNQFKQGKYEAAIKDFTVARFGLLEDKKLATELNLYAAVAHFKLKHHQQVKDIINKIKSEHQVTEISQLPVPLALKKEIGLIMVVYFGQKRVYEVKVAQRIAFARAFAQGLQQLRARDLDNLKKTIKKLKKIDKRDERLAFLQGALAGMQKKYRTSLKYLRDIADALGPNLRNELYYYIAEAFYSEENYGQTLAFYYKIDNQALRSKLSQVIKQVLQVRDREIEKNSRQFTQKSMNKLLKQFPGDSHICTDLLAKLTRIYKKNSQRVRQILFSCLKFPAAYNQEFILKSVAYLQQLGEIPQAIGLLEGCKYIKTKNKAGIEILYKLGELYMNTYDFNKARELFLQVNRLQKDYRKTNFYIDRIKKIQYNK